MNSNISQQILPQMILSGSTSNMFLLSKEYFVETSTTSSRNEA